MTTNAFKDTEIGPIPEEWQLVPIVELTEADRALDEVLAALGFAGWRGESPPSS